MSTDELNPLRDLAPAATPSVRRMGQEDVTRVVDIHLAAFSNFFLSFLGRSFLRLLYSEAESLGEIALVAKEQTTIVGFVMGSHRPGNFYAQMLRRRAFHFAFAATPAILRQPRCALRVARAVLRPKKASHTGQSATLMSLAVDPTIQSRGVGQVLVDRFLREAKKRGASSVDLTTDKYGNDRVNRFYSSLGFQIDGEIRTPEGRVLNEYRIAI